MNSTSAHCGAGCWRSIIPPNVGRKCFSISSSSSSTTTAFTWCPSNNNRSHDDDNEQEDTGTCDVGETRNDKNDVAVSLPQHQSDSVSIATSYLRHGHAIVDDEEFHDASTTMKVMMDLSKEPLTYSSPTMAATGMNSSNEATLFTHDEGSSSLSSSAMLILATTKLHQDNSPVKRVDDSGNSDANTILAVNDTSVTDVGSESVAVDTTMSSVATSIQTHTTTTEVEPISIKSAIRWETPILFEIVGAMGLSLSKNHPEQYQKQNSNNDSYQATSNENHNVLSQRTVSLLDIEDEDDVENESAAAEKSSSNLSTNVDTTSQTDTNDMLQYLIPKFVQQEQHVDPYCIVRVPSLYCADSTPTWPAIVRNNNNNKWRVVHRTKIIENDIDPIWTLQSGSLCLLRLVSPQSKLQPSISSKTLKRTFPKSLHVPLPPLLHKSASLVRKSMRAVRSSARKIVKPWKILAQSNMIHISEDVVIIEVRCRGKRSALGVVTIPISDLMAVCISQENDDAVGEDHSTRDISVVPDETDDDYDTRHEYVIRSTPDSLLRPNATLAVRYRRASKSDVKFLNEFRADNNSVLQLLNVSQIPQTSFFSKLFHSGGNDVHEHYVATDFDFRHVVKHTWFQHDKTRSKYDQIQRFRVMPYPDPTRPTVETEFLSHEEIELEALKPSTRWITVGHGTVGTIYLEIVGCDNLPNLDMPNLEAITHDRTDPFVTIVYESNMVRTDVLFDQLNPRWMPWATRAFEFRIRHPSSLLHISVFDFDEAPLMKHNPVGRIVLGTTTFEANTDYLLHYELQHDPRIKEV
jgi:hypothetical protein